MRLLRAVCLVCVVSFLVSTAFAAEFLASTLEAKDVDCKKCHAETPHKIHADRPVDCVNCHGSKTAVSIPQCTNCHDGTIHTVHAGKVAIQSCAYCHKTLDQVHNALTKDAVCTHCHKDLIDVHGKNASCAKCHKTAPDIVKPLKSPEMMLVCQNCHPKPSVATIHGEATDKKACYSCHKAKTKAAGSEIPHLIHANKVDCSPCHQETGKLVIPLCTKCHQIDTLHAFNTIAKLTPETGLKCSACHVEEPKPSPAITPRVTEHTPAPVETPQTMEEVKTPGFAALMAIAAVLTIAIRRRL